MIKFSSLSAGYYIADYRTSTGTLEKGSVVFWWDSGVNKLTRVLKEAEDIPAEEVTIYFPQSAHSWVNPKTIEEAQYVLLARLWTEKWKVK